MTIPIEDVPHLRTAMKTAKKSNHLAFKHAAILIRGGNVVSAESNHGLRHAEDRTISKCWDTVQKGSILISIRVTVGGLLANGKPCEACEKLIRASGIKTVFYSTAERTIERIKY